MAKGRIAKQAKQKLNMIIFGDTFTGKTTLASQLAYYKREDGKPFRILYIDAETGGLDSYLDEMEQNGINLNNIYILYTQSLAEVRDYISKVKNGEDLYVLDEDGNETEDIVVDADGKPFRADAIIVDGASILHMTTQSGLLEMSKKRNKVKAEKAGLIGDEKFVKVEGASLELKDWNTIKFKGQDLILDLMSSGVHCITTCREADEKQTVKTDDGQITSVCTGKKVPEGFKGLDYNTNTVLRMFVDPDSNAVCAEVLKDRTHVHQKGEIIEDPTLLDWQTVIDKNKGREDFVLKNDLTKAVEVEQNLYEKEVLGKVGSPIEETKTDTVSEENIEKLKKEIVAKRTALPPEKKTKKKAELSEAGLPGNLKNVNDIEVLKQILKIIESE